MKTLHLRIHARVQGVWYRESMRREAERLNVAGWVRNASDGSVEAVVQGSAAAVDALIQWARSGPPLARFERIELDEAHGQFSGFENGAISSAPGLPSCLDRQKNARLMSRLNIHQRRRIGGDNTEVLLQRPQRY